TCWSASRWPCPRSSRARSATCCASSPRCPTPRRGTTSASTEPRGERTMAGEQDRAVFVISVAAELAGVHPQTLRIYQREGLVRPKRTTAHTRHHPQPAPPPAAPALRARGPVPPKAPPPHRPPLLRAGHPAAAGDQAPDRRRHEPG